MKKGKQILNQFSRIDMKHQLFIWLKFMIGYFSPLCGIAIYGYAKVKKQSRLDQCCPLVGAGIALGFYLISYGLYFMNNGLL